MIAAGRTRTLLTALLAALLVAGCKRDGARNGARTGAPAQLRIYNWSQYLPDSIIVRFERETGIDVTQDFYSSNEEMLARIEAGNPGFDMVVPGDYMVHIMIGKGLLRPLDKAAVPTLSNLDPRFARPPFDPGLRHCVPYTVGTNGIAVNTDKVKVDEVTWEWLFHPPEELRGRITVLDDARMTIGAALKATGHGFNATDSAALAEAEAALLAQKPFLLAYDSDKYSQLLASGDAWVSYGYSGDMAQAQEENPTIRYFLPASGSVYWVDSFCILKDARNPEAAHRFLAFLLRPENHALVSNELRYGTPNAAARSLLAADVKNNPTIFPPDSMLDRMEFIADVGDRIGAFQRVWSRVKAR